MNKSLLALAVLGAFAGAASAQSSVTIYGLIDQNVKYQDPGRLASVAGGRPGKGVTRVDDGGTGGLGSSRLGFRGVEDMGDGLKAIFRLELGVSPDTGGAGGRTTLQGTNNVFFNREAWVGLESKSLGTVRLGRLNTQSRDIRYFIDATNEREFSVVENMTSARPLFQNFGSRVDNGVNYRSPSLGGFELSVSVGLAEDLTTSTTTTTTAVAGSPGNVRIRTTAVNAEASEYQGVGLTFKNGPIAAALTYEQLNGGIVSGSYNKVVTIGGNYDFGIAKLFAAYQNTKDFGGQLASTTTVTDSNTIDPNPAPAVTTFAKGVDVDAYNIGVRVPLGKQWLLKAQYTGSTVDRLGALSDLDQEKYGVSIAYLLSKRTSVYAVVTQRSGDEDETFARKGEYLVGVNHTF